jgi:FkbH-like protein
MFEIGARYTAHTTPELPRFSKNRLEEALAARILRRSFTVWQDHCSECAMPSCYATCEFYRPRLDYKCERLDGGVRVIPERDHVAVPMMIKFGRWARLMGYGPAGLFEVGAARRRESRALTWGRLAEHIPASRGIAAPVRRRITNHLSLQRAWGKSDLTHLFMTIECMNPGPHPVNLVFSFGLTGAAHASGAEIFRTTVALLSGYSVHTIPVTDFMSREMLDRPFFIQLAPAEADERPELAFGLLDVVELSTASPATLPHGTVASQRPLAAAESKLKCVVWDLDNTLWHGILVEDGLDGLSLNPQAVEAIRAFDAKGVLQSIVSKNDAEDALAALKKFALDEYFLFPQISWHPKSEGIKRVREKLNIGMDTFAFVDDQPFERSEVAAALPDVLTVDPAELSDFLNHTRLDLPITAEASQRRLLYRAEGQREQARSDYGGAYEEFLRSCEMTTTIASFTAARIDRVYELVQRTNQLNISTCRYNREELAGLNNAGSPRRAFVIDAADKFGTYGLIGFAVFEPERNLILDLMFSCRVQGKLVDDAFVSWLAETHVGREPGILRARFKANKKNAPAKQLLERLGFLAHDTDGDFEIWEKASPGRSLADIRRVISVDAQDTIA